jgi:hypothetical protein
LLQDGRVLAAGGYNGSFLFTATCELYDPASGTWTVTASLITARNGHVATLLSGGNVLVEGGEGDGYLASTELYNPATGSWTAGGNLNIGRFLHTATLLGNGRVIVAGGNHGGIAAEPKAELGGRLP